MAYFNGHGFTDMNGQWRYAPTTAIYCDECAETAIPLLPRDGGHLDGQRHRGTDFKWASHYGGSTKCKCGKLV